MDHTAKSESKHECWPYVPKLGYILPLKMLTHLKRLYRAAKAIRHTWKMRQAFKGEFCRLTLYKALSEIKLSFLLKYHRMLLSFIGKHIQMPESATLPRPIPADKMRVWVMWWQGEDCMPPLVKATFASIKRHAAGREVVLITKDNISEWVKLPPCISSKITQGKITYTTLSDYIRYYLLSNYGGLWVDSTMLMVKDIPHNVLTGSFFSLKRVKLRNRFNVSLSRWNGQFLSSTQAHYHIFETMRLLWEQYWEKFDANIDYFMTDYLLAFAYENDSDIRAAVDNVSPSNEKLYALGYALNKPFDKDEWKRMKEGQDMFKLSYKVKDKGRSNTYMSKLLAGGLN